MELFIILLSLTIITAVVSLPGTLVVKIGTRLMGRFGVSFHTAYTAVASSYAAYFIIQVVFNMFLKIRVNLFVSLGIIYLLHAWSYFRRVRSDDGDVLSIPASLVIALFQVLVTGIVVVLLINLPCGISYRPGKP